MCFRGRLPKKAAPLGLLGERLVSEAARLPRDTCGASDPRAADHRLGSVGLVRRWAEGMAALRMPSHMRALHICD